ncbi:MAG: hypothetical protein WA532_12375 [Candidatus Korobacteraceae bacterium]
MGAAAELRKQIESALAGRIPAALSLRPHSAPELIPCGLAEVDAMLGGGLPLGAITELTGSHSSARTTLALATLAGLTRQGHSCAYVDLSDALDPLSAAALGVELHRLLWVRPAASRPTPALRLDSALRATDLLLNAGGFRALVLDLGDLPPEQTRRIPLATWYRFRLQAEKSRTLFLLITCALDCAQGCAQTHAQSYVKSYAQSCAAVTLHCRPAEPHWRQAAEHSPLLLAGLRHRLSLERGRAVDPRKKPAASAPAFEAAWSSRTPWTG